MNHFKIFIASSILGAALIPAALAAPHTPPKGSGERTVIMNALHHVLGSGRHQPLVTARNVNVERGWAYVTGGFSYADGAPLEDDFQNGPGTNFDALLHHEGGRWRVKRRVYAGDVEESDFMRAFPQAPRGIFQVNYN